MHLANGLNIVEKVGSQVLANLQQGTCLMCGLIPGGLGGTPQPKRILHHQTHLVQQAGNAFKAHSIQGHNHIFISGLDHVAMDNVPMDTHSLSPAWIIAMFFPV